MIQTTTKEAYELLHKGTLVFGRADAMGIRIDVEYCKRKKAHLTRKIDRLEKQLSDSELFKEWRKAYGTSININSGTQLAHLLYDIRGVTPPKLTSSEKQGATDEETLSQLEVPEIQDLLKIKQLKKIRDTYLESFVREQVEGYVHPFSNLHTVVTYRSSMDHPNPQNIPVRDKEAMKICRRAIFPRPGHQLVELDYSRIEVKVATCYHKDPNMIAEMKDPSLDMHLDMAKELFLLQSINKKDPVHKTLRNAAKNGFVFPQFYGDYYVHCADRLACQWGGLPKKKWRKGEGLKMPSGYLSDHLIMNGIRSYTEFEEHVRKVEERFWNVRFPVYRDWKEEWWKLYQKTGHLDMLTGFRCGGVMRKNEVVNRPIQGSAFHCLLWSFIEIDELSLKEDWDSRLIGQIHDAILLDVLPKEFDYILETAQRIMCEALPKAWPWIIVPLEVEADVCGVDQPWSTKEAYNLG